MIGASPNAGGRAMGLAVLTAAATFVLLLLPVVIVFVAAGMSPTHHDVILVASIGAVTAGGLVGARVHRHLARPWRRRVS